jgi:hypothetical protein
MDALEHHFALQYAFESTKQMLCANLEKNNAGAVHLKIVAADSGVAIPNDSFDPVQVVVTYAVTVEQPYT